MTDPYCRGLFIEYGKVMRRIKNAGYSYTDINGKVHKHEDGHRGASSFSLISNGGITGGSAYIQRFDEVHTDGSMAVKRAVVRLSEEQRVIFDAKWIYRVTYRVMAGQLGLKKSRCAELVWSVEDKMTRLILGTDCGVDS